MGWGKTRELHFCIEVNVFSLFLIFTVYIFTYCAQKQKKGLEAIRPKKQKQYTHGESSKSPPRAQTFSFMWGVQKKKTLLLRIFKLYECWVKEINNYKRIGNN
eukprot:GEMP01087893.1.p1 GENE.GEMP01087893.1~~GEMP01087893.1.p1  ORF type:complete len:103 (-),score=3.53 GEMP01087893.1:473-781(-)